MPQWPEAAGQQPGAIRLHRREFQCSRTRGLLRIVFYLPGDQHLVCFRKCREHGGCYECRFCKMPQVLIHSAGTVSPEKVWIHMDWGDKAACLTVDPELFFPVGNTGPAVDQIDRAKSVCSHCPVTEYCLQYALDTNQDSGVWGGNRDAMSGDPQPQVG